MNRQTSICFMAVCVSAGVGSHSEAFERAPLPCRQLLSPVAGLQVTMVNVWKHTFLRKDGLKGWVWA